MESLWDTLRPEMQEVMNGMLIFFDQKHMQWLNQMDDKFWLQEILWKTRSGVLKRKSTYTKKLTHLVFAERWVGRTLRTRAHWAWWVALLVGLVVQFKGKVGVGKILLGLLSGFVLRFNQVKQSLSFFSFLA